MDLLSQYTIQSKNKVNYSSLQNSFYFTKEYSYIEGYSIQFNDDLNIGGIVIIGNNKLEINSITIKNKELIFFLNNGENDSLYGLNFLLITTKNKILTLKSYVKTSFVDIPRNLWAYPINGITIDGKPFFLNQKRVVF